MLEFSLFGVRLRFSFLFFAVVTATLIIDRSGVAITGLICCVLHEAGHIAAFAALNRKPGEVTFDAFGIKLISPAGIMRFKDEIFVLSAGCAVNFFLAGALYAFGVKNNFFISNLVIGLFNIMPVYALDGGRIVYTILSMRLLPESAKAAVNAISVITIVPMLIFGGLLLYSSKNITLLLTSLYLLSLLILKSGGV